MTRMKIGEAARASGVSVKTIRFYEEAGLLLPPPRTEGGYRTFSVADVRRLRLARRARLLGLSLREVRGLLQEALSLECGDLAERLLKLIAERRTSIERQIEELRALQHDLDELASHVRHSRDVARPGDIVSECEFCPILDEERR